MTMPETIYRKKGRRYIPVGVHDDAHYYYPIGASLVWARPDHGGTLTRYGIEPADAALLAAADRMRDAMVAAMREANRVKPASYQGRRPLTAKQKKAWAAFEAIAGKTEGFVLEGVSLFDVVDAGIKALADAAAKGQSYQNRSAA